MEYLYYFLIAYFVFGAAVGLFVSFVTYALGAFQGGQLGFIDVIGLVLVCAFIWPILLAALVVGINRS